MEIQDYQNLKNKLETLKNNHRNKYDRNASGYLDPCSITVKMFGDWRLKKKVEVFLLMYQNLIILSKGLVLKNQLKMETFISDVHDNRQHLFITTRKLC